MLQATESHLYPGLQGVPPLLRRHHVSNALPAALLLTFPSQGYQCSGPEVSSKSSSPLLALTFPPAKAPQVLQRAGQHSGMPTASFHKSGQ